MQLKAEEIYLAIDAENTLHIKKIYTDASLAPAVFIHGIAENGRIFYSKNLKGCAPYFAQHYSCYVVDLRGKGLSSPKISSNSQFNHLDIISDLLIVFNKISELHRDQKQVWLAHSWGGVLIHSMLLRNPTLIERMKSCVFFGSKRHISIKTLEKEINIDIVFNRLFTLIGKVYGFIPPILFGIDSETLPYHQDVVELVKSPSYIEPSDKFNYGEVAKNCKLPKCLYIAAKNDTYLGHPQDVKRFMHECGHEESFWLLSKENGNLHDYDHNSMVTHSDAAADYFGQIASWLENS